MSTIVLIPGINPKAAKGIFDAIRKALPKEIFVELEAASEAELVKKKPKGKFVLVGKSAGGRIALMHQLANKDAQALVLLAPAVEADESFAEIEVPVLIVHGTADDVVPIENSHKLHKILPNIEMVSIEGADHSYRRKEKETSEEIKKWLGNL